MDWRSVIELLSGSGVALLIVTQIFANKKSKAEIAELKEETDKLRVEKESLQTQNREKIFEIYNKELALMETRIGGYVEIINRNQERINELERKIDLLVHQNITLKGEIAELKKNNNDGKTVCDEIQSGSIKLRK